MMQRIHYFVILGIGFCLVFFLGSKSVYAIDQYKCKIDTTGTNCIACIPSSDPALAGSLADCDAGLPGLTCSPEASQRCANIGATNCPDTGTKLGTFNSISCTGSTPPPLPNCGTHPNGVWQCLAASSCSGLQDSNYACTGTSVCCQMTPPGSSAGYKCKVDNGACVPCTQDSVSPNDITKCATGATCPNANEPTSQCGGVPLTNCPDTDTKLEGFSLLACAPAPTIPPPVSPAIQPIPQPVPYGCDETTSEGALTSTNRREFHSLRPYQASICNTDYQTGLYCGNSVYLTDTFTETKEGITTPSDPGTTLLSRNCVDHPELGVVVCDFGLNRIKTFSIDLRQLELPIMGNTEDVTNVTNASKNYANREHIEHPQKINEYTSWYLNGTTERAEYPILDGGEEKDANTNISAHDYVVNYSGPLKRLLPLRIQTRERLAQIDDAHTSVTEDTRIRHNQIAGCTARNTLSISIGPITLVPNAEVPFPCNRLSGFRSLFAEEVKKRLAGDDGNSGWFLKQNQPPLEEDYQNKPFVDYWEAYQEWRGKVCKQVKIGLLPTMLLCVKDPTGNIGLQDYVAEMFPQIPFSSTEDTLGKVRVEQNPQAIGQTDPIVVSNESVTQASANIYVPHMPENYQLADTLQQTFVPQDLPLDAPADATTTVGDEFCNVIQVKTNPGDNMFGNELNPRLSYNSAFSCEFGLPPKERTNACYDASKDCHEECVTIPPLNLVVCHTVCESNARCYPTGYHGCSNSWGQQGCDTDYFCAEGCDPPDVADCRFTTLHSIPVYTETPYIDQIWSKLVAGPTSVFKRIFPKIGLDGPLTEIVDAPTAMNSSYTTTDPGTTIRAGNAASGVLAQLYFPHVGGIHEYFLECIQTALRPQGLGRVCGDFNRPEPISCQGTISQQGRKSFGPWVSMDTNNHAHVVYIESESIVGVTNAKLMYMNNAAGAFSRPVVLATDIGASSAVIDIDKQNKIHLVYHKNNTDVFYQQGAITGSSVSWTAPERQQTVGKVAFPFVKADDDGNAHIAWTDRRCGTNHAYYTTRSSGGSYSAVEQPIAGCSFERNPRLTITDNGNVHLAVEHSTEIWYARRESGGWTSQKNISNTRDNSYNPSITTDGTSLFVVWGDGINGHDVLLVYSNNNGTSWSSKIGVSTSPAFADLPSISYSQETKTAHIVWSDATGADNWEIWFAQFNPVTNTISQTKRLTITPGDSTAPIIDTATGADGIVWQERVGVQNILQVIYLGATITGGEPVFDSSAGQCGAPSTSPPPNEPTITPPPGGQCTLSNADILQRINSWGLPPPQANTLNGVRGYTTLRSQISSGAGNWSALTMLAAEQYAKGHGYPNLIDYLTTGWLWLENGPGSYPDPYEINCNKEGNPPGISDTSAYCTSTNFQIAGYQAATRAINNDYVKAMNNLYPGATDETFRLLLQRVANDSNNAHVTAWKYNRIPANGILQYLPDVLATGSISQMATNRIELIGGLGNATAERRQLLTLLTGKDPYMVAALNSFAVSQGDLINRGLIPGGPTGCSTTQGYTTYCGATKQALSNIVYALWMISCGQ